jgi:hypothetical protein
VLGRPLPARSKRIVLQGKAPGFAWTDFARLGTNRTGGFSRSCDAPASS